MEFSELILLIILLLLFYKLVYAAVKRTACIIRINSLKRESGATVKYLRCPYLSFFKASAKPDAVVTVGDTVYLLRFISGIGGFRRLHFANKEFYVIYKTARIHAGGKIYKRPFRRAAENHGYRLAYGARVRILPPLEIPEEYKRRDEYDTTEVLHAFLFNPAPCEVSYVTPEKTSIKVAFTGDKVHDASVFTGSSFVAYADRHKREREREKKREYGFNTDF